MTKGFAAFFSLLLVVASAPAAESFKVGAFTFAVPEGWTKVEPSSPMRNAQLEIVQGSAKAEVTFFHFGGGSGTAAANVARWFSQFPGSEEKRKTEVVESGPVKITFASTVGTFSSGMPGGPTTPITGAALFGAILENQTGDVYVKMTGPEALVKSSTEALRHMVLEAVKTTAPGA
ncbi:MAG TPA: hypothetical protein VK474_03280 [Chthoniobacterales bacterium]|nr:hypothetical protein [Chthoniobacterales bacterium]